MAKKHRTTLRYDIEKYTRGHLGYMCKMFSLDPERIGDANYLLEKFPEDLPDAIGARGEVFDFVLANQIASRAQTIRFPTQFALDMRKSIGKNRFDEAVFFMPFDNLIIEFTEPIPEEYFIQTDQAIEDYERDLVNRLRSNPKTSSLFRATFGEESIERLDQMYGTTSSIAALLLTTHSDNQYAEVCVWFRSTNTLRVTWNIETLEIIASKNPLGIPEIANLNRRTIQELTLACIDYVNADNVIIERRGGVSEKIARKRTRRGKKPLEGYYVTRLKKEKYDDIELFRRGTGGQHGYMYPVARHRRRLSDGRVIIVKGHHRGLRHGEDSQRERVQQVIEPKGDKRE